MRSSAPVRDDPAREPAIEELHHDYVRVLDSMSCGVMLVDGEGIVRSLNRMTAELLGLDRSEVVNHSFAEAFLARGELDEFNETVLAAVYDNAVGHQRLVRVQVAGRSVPISVATSYLRGDPSDDSSSRLGVVAVIIDMTELEALRERETALARDLHSKHSELRDAYRSLEDRNRALGALLRKVQLARVVASAFVVALMVGLGAYLWHDPGLLPLGSGAAAANGVSAPAQRSFATLEPSPVSSSISVPTRLRPRSEAVVTSPIEGVVARVHIEPGQAVDAGDLLFELDVSELRIERRDAEVSLLRAQAELRELEQWENGVEVSKARRALSRSRIALEAGAQSLAKDRFLLEQGLVARDRVDRAEREQDTRRLDHEAASQDLDSILSLGQERLRVARLELANAEAALAKLDAVLEQASVRAPLPGVVLGEGARSGLSVRVGSSVKEGALLAAVGDVSGFTADGRVSEVDVRRVHVGQPVQVSGPAFPGVVLRGSVTHLSSEASSPRGRRLPSFQLTAALDLPRAPARSAVRLGMSANMRIVVYHNPEALLVPVAAVDLGSDPPIVRVDDGDGGVRIVSVRTGITTVDSVEVLEGLAPGDRVLVP